MDESRCDAPTTTMASTQASSSASTHTTASTQTSRSGYVNFKEIIPPGTASAQTSSSGYLNFKDIIPPAYATQQALKYIQMAKSRRTAQGTEYYTPHGVNSGPADKGHKATEED